MKLQDMEKLCCYWIISMIYLIGSYGMANPLLNRDTTIRNLHVTDGMVSEWQADKFQTDPDSQILFSADNDASQLYLVLKIPNESMQMRMMTMGMNLYLDKKGKKREGTGIEFPIKREGQGSGAFRGGAGRPGGENRNPSSGREAPDKNNMRERLANMMIFMKTFGFDGQEDKSQLIGLPDHANIAFDWDEANTLYIEYQIPLNFMGGQAALQGKPLGIGWKLNGMPEPAGAFASSTTTIVGRPSSGGGGGSRTGRGTPASTTDLPSFNNDNNRFKEQSFWTKYQIQ